MLGKSLLVLNVPLYRTVTNQLRLAQGNLTDSVAYAQHQESAAVLGRSVDPVKLVAAVVANLSISLDEFRTGRAFPHLARAQGSLLQPVDILWQDSADENTYRTKQEGQQKAFESRTALLLTDGHPCRDADYPHDSRCKTLHGYTSLPPPSSAPNPQLARVSSQLTRCYATPNLRRTASCAPLWNQERLDVV